MIDSKNVHGIFLVFLVLLVTILVAKVTKVRHGCYFQGPQIQRGRREVCMEEQHLEQIWGVVTTLEKSDTYPSSEGHIDIF